MDAVDATQCLARYVAKLSIDTIPGTVIDRTEDLFLDWVGSALAGWSMHPVPVFERFAASMGPDFGRCEVLGARRRTSPWFAAFVNGASSHVAEQDDLHNSSVLHPATVVFPAVLAAAQDRQMPGSALLVAAVAGYEVGIRVGEFLGRSHYRHFHTTGTVGTVAAAVAVGKLLGLDQERLVDAIGSAGTQAAGLWEFLRDAADSKQLHTAKAAADGLTAAYMAEDGLTGAKRVLDGAQGMAAGMSSDADPARLVDGLGSRWATTETSFKLHASCRHTHPAADALDQLMRQEGLAHTDIVAIEARVHQAALDVLGRVEVPLSVHQAKFSMGTMLGLIAVFGKAGLDEFDRSALTDPDVARIRTVTRLVFDPEVDQAYPARWLGRVLVSTADGRTLAGAIDEPRGDPGNPLSRAELEGKFMHIGGRSGTWSGVELERLLGRVRGIRSAQQMELLR